MQQIGIKIRQKHLYFICPTDHIEAVINNTFKHDNYYYSSLGNSIIFDEGLMKQIENLIKEKGIQKISFVLADDNSIILDALKKQDFSAIPGLTNFYDQVLKHKHHSEVSWQTSDHHILILSYLLNSKINELQKELNSLATSSIEIDGKIYNKRENAFNAIYSELICREYFDLN